MIPVDTGYWRKKWDDTLGYLVFKKSFSSMDVLNAKFRHNRRFDGNFPIEFNKTTFSIVQNKVKERLDKDLFWSALIAPTQAFFDGDWMNYTPRGEEFREIQLVKVANNPERLLHLSVGKREEAYRSIIEELKTLGLSSDYHPPSVAYIPPKIPRRKRDILAEDVVKTQEVIDVLDELF